MEEPLNGGPGATVSVFDYSTENHLRAMDKISKLCEEPEIDGLDQADIRRFSSSVTFLREWKYFNYEPRVIRFVNELQNSTNKDVSGGIELPQFSSATVPKVKQQDGLYGSNASAESCKDFVMYVGGSVWALDWCPQVHENPKSPVKCEFIAIAAHPPESYYHKLGTPLVGRGLIQIWCVLNVGVNEEEAPLSKKRPKRKSQNTEAMEGSSSKKPIGRPRKKPRDEPQPDPVKIPNDRPRRKPIGESPSNPNLQPLAVQYPEGSFMPVSLDNVPGNTEENIPDKSHHKKQKGIKEAGTSDATPKTSTKSTKMKRKTKAKSNSDERVQNEESESSSAVNQQIDLNYGPDATVINNMLGSNLLEDSPSKKPRGRPRKKSIDEPQPDQVKIPNGRSRKKPIGESLNDPNLQPLAVEYPEGSFLPVSLDIVPGNTEENIPDKNHHKKQKRVKEAGTSDATPKTSMKSTKRKSKTKAKSNNDGKIQNEESESSSAINQQINLNYGQDATEKNNILGSNLLEDSPGSTSIPEDISLPRAVLCLAHNGKVAWDVKWQPRHINDSKCNRRMGYLAVLLGNGSLEVWEVPLPNMIKNVYASSPKQGTDPRFVKLEPVFKCSKLKCGNIQSIPLTLEWSTSPPHDYLLAGCHDGMVALWKFSASSPKSNDTRPLLCFSADTAPIRSLAWAPCGSDTESSNVILTAGHGGLKFWDIRDPYLPLWDVHPAPKFIYSMDWLPEPRCLLISFDDGTMKLLSLVHAACDIPVTGKPFGGTKQQGLHLYNCSSFAIWSVQVSRLTGMVAYCGADGTATCFQLTSKAMDNFSRNRAPHFACGSLTEEESGVIVNTPLPDIPLPLRKPSHDCVDGQRSMRYFLSESNSGKNAKDKKAKVPTSNKQTLALFDGNDPGMESEPEETLAALRRKNKQKSKSDGKKKVADDQTLALRIEEPTNRVKEETGKAAESETEKFPPKVVAMHRVRWNMNKGSERWLCYGGAAGIVRCQVIRLSDADKKSTRKC